MATVSTTGGMTQIELASRTHNNALLQIVNPLSVVNRAMLYMQWTECNNGTTYKGTRVSTEPTGTWRDYDEGVSQGTGTTTPYEEPTSTLAHIFSIDKDRKDDAPDPEQYVSDELEIEMRGLVKQSMSAFFYGDRDGDASFAGKMPRGIIYRSDYNNLASEYVYDNGGGSASATANKTSLYVISSGPKKIQMIFPRNYAMGGIEPSQNVDAQASPVEGLGIKMMRLAKDTAEDANGREYPADNLWFTQRWGMCIHDPRYLRRMCNISTTNIDEVDDFSFNEDYLIDIITQMPDRNNAFVCGNRAVEAQIWKRVKDSSSRYFERGEDAFGEPVPVIMGLPFALCDSITSDEATVS